jgi:hypothetical protein
MVALTEYHDVLYVPSGDTVWQIGDVYVPSTGGPYPIVQKMHGGGGNVGDKLDVNNAPLSRDIPRNIARAGFCVWNINYTLGTGVGSSGAPNDPANNFPAGLYDCISALKFMKTNASTYNADPNRYAVWGGSAGGSYAQLLGDGEWVAGTISGVDFGTQDKFLSPDTTSITGRTTPIGAKTWSAPNFGISSHKLYYSGTVPSVGVTIARATYIGSNSKNIDHFDIQIATGRMYGGPHFNSADVTQDPAGSLELAIIIVGATKQFVLRRRTTGAVFTTLGTKTMGVGGVPTIGLGQTWTFQVDKRRWPLITIRAKVYGQADSLYQSIWTDLDLSAIAGFDYTTFGTYLGKGIHGQYGPASGDGTARILRVEGQGHHDLGILSVLSASGYSDTRVSAFSPPTDFDLIALGWFGCDDQTDPTCLAKFEFGSSMFTYQPSRPPTHLWGSQHETCPQFQQTVYYAMLNAQGRAHYDGDLHNYVGPADTMHIYAGDHHADYKDANGSVLHEYLRVLTADLISGGNGHFFVSSEVKESMTFSISPTPGADSQVSLVSDDPHVRVPDFVMLRAGAGSVTFPVTVSDVSDVGDMVFAVVTATDLADSVSIRMFYEVDWPSIASISFNTSVVQPGTTITGTVKLLAPVPIDDNYYDDGYTVYLTSDDPRLLLPASVVVPQGADSVQFEATYQ